VLEHPHLAPVLVLDVARRLLRRVRLGVVDRAPAALHHRVRERHVVPVARIDLDVVRAPDRVDRALTAGDRPERGLVLAQAVLIAPVDALAIRPVRAEETELTADVGDLGVGEAPHEEPERVP
jgi:hypothetical protein